MKISDYIADCIKGTGAGTVFGFQGSNAAHLIDSIARRGLRYLQNHHEQASAFAAGAYAEISGCIGAAVASSGPGAINLIAGMADAWFDSVPVLFLTGQLNTAAVRADSACRQHGFQEFDIVSTVSGFTKYAVTVRDVSLVRYHLEKALYLANEGRKGPVLLDIPHNIQRAEASVEDMRPFIPADSRTRQCADKSAVEAASALMQNSLRPVLLLGGGASELRGGGELLRLAERFDMPVTASLRGLDIFPEGDPRFAGFIGSYGNRYANIAVSEADLLLVLGSRLDPHQTGGDPSQFAPNAKIIRVDIDPAELRNNVTPSEGICCPASEFLNDLMRVTAGICSTHHEWRARVDALKARYPDVDESDPANLPNGILRAVSPFFEGMTVTADVGQNQMWTAQSVRFKKAGRLLNSGGLGAMGYSLPAAIGAAAAGGGRVLAVCGDGGLQMNLQELGTVARENLPVKVLLMNNRSLGMIRSYQAVVFGNAVGSVDGFSSPNYKDIAAAYGMRYAVVRSAPEAEKLGTLFEDPLPLLCEVELTPDTEIHPEPAYRRPVHVQSPILRGRP